MSGRTRLPRGPIRRRAAKRELERFLGVAELREAEPLQIWAIERGALLDDPEDPDLWLRRHGRLQVAKLLAGHATQIYAPPLRRPGRPRSVGMHRANARLLIEYPQLRRSPFHFALLEAMWKLDLDEEHRFAPPRIADEDPGLGDLERARVRDRARRRLQRAAEYIAGLKRANRKHGRP